MSTTPRHRFRHWRSGGLVAGIAAGVVASVLLFSGGKAEQTRIESCASVAAETARIECVASRTMDRMERDGERRALRALEAASRDHDAIADVCHRSMHEAARLRWSPDASGPGWMPGACVSGYLHGLVETSIARGGSSAFELAARNCAAQRTADPRSGVAARECFHGMGHGAWRASGSIEPALVACDTAIADAGARSKCYGGVFMEHAVRRTPHPSSMLETCRATRPAARGACLAFGRPGSVSSTTARARWCGGAGDAAAASFCFMLLGRSETADQGLPACTEMAAGGGLLGACIAGYLRGNVAEARTVSLQSAASRCERLAPAAARSCARELGALAPAARALDLKDSERTCHLLTVTSLARACVAGERRPRAIDAMAATNP